MHYLALLPTRGKDNRIRIHDQPIPFITVWPALQELISEQFVRGTDRRIAPERLAEYVAALGLE